MSSVVQLIGAPSLADTPYAYAATAPAGSRLVFLAGACPLSGDGTIKHPGDYAAQASRCITLMGVTVLGYPDQLVEIEVVAAVRDAEA